jgi:hypothetical protein
MTTNLLEQLEPIQKLSRDLKQASITLSDREARYLVDAYYSMQDFRTQGDSQVRSMSATGEPHAVNKWLATQTRGLENQLKLALGAFAESKRPGRWALSQVGIGPVITAGLLAHLDIAKAPTAGHFWRYAGLDPTLEWQGKEKAAAWVKAHKHLSPEEMLAVAGADFKRRPELIRKVATFDPRDPETPKTLTHATIQAGLARRPWNAKLKVLMWKAGESFKKFHNHPECYYGHVYQQRKLLEVERNEAGKFADQAQHSLETKNITNSELRAKYKAGKLPDGRLDLRAARYATKLFISHLHWVMFECHHNSPPPKPYVIEHLGHVHLLTPPGWPCE